MMSDALIRVALKVPSGDSCLLIDELRRGRCHHYKSKSCHVFNKVIVNDKKCPECVAATVSPADRKRLSKELAYR